MMNPSGNSLIPNSPLLLKGQKKKKWKYSKNVQMSHNYKNTNIYNKGLIQSDAIHQLLLPNLS